MALKATKHCCWGVCNSDSRYSERLPPETSFLRFPKPGKVKDNMTVAEKPRTVKNREIKDLVACLWEARV